jgi:hypothetical protein
MPMTAFLDFRLRHKLPITPKNISRSSNDSGNTMSLASTAGNKKRSSEHCAGIDIPKSRRDSEKSRPVHGKPKTVPETIVDADRQPTDPEVVDRNTMSLASTASNKKRLLEHGVGIDILKSRRDSQKCRRVRGKLKTVAETNPEADCQPMDPEVIQLSVSSEQSDFNFSEHANISAFDDLFVRTVWRELGDQETSKSALIMLDSFELGLHEEMSLVRSALCSRSICQNILKAMSDHPLDEEVQKVACQLVFDLSRHNYNTNFKESFITAGAAEVIRSATSQETSGKSFRENEQLIFLGNLALSSLGKDTFIVR